jgi:hypothetical protein
VKRQSNPKEIALPGIRRFHHEKTILIDLAIRLLRLCRMGTGGFHKANRPTFDLKPNCACSLRRIPIDHLDFNDGPAILLLLNAYFQGHQKIN